MLQVVRGVVARHIGADAARVSKAVGGWGVDGYGVVGIAV